MAYETKLPSAGETLMNGMTISRKLGLKIIPVKLKPGIPIYPQPKAPVALKNLWTDTNSKQGAPRRKITTVARFAEFGHDPKVRAPRPPMLKKT